MTDLVAGELGVDTVTTDAPFAYVGCGCAICRAIRDTGEVRKGGVDDDITVSPGDLDPTGASYPPNGELLNLQRDPAGFYFFTGNRNIDAVLIGSKWKTLDLTYSFPTDGSNYNQSGTESGYNLYHIDAGANQQAAAREAFRQLSSYTNLTFTEITETDTVNANIRISQTNDSSNGSANGQFPSDKRVVNGDIWFGRTSQPYYDMATKGSWGFATMLHEIGHTMGLKHGGGDGLNGDYTNVDLSFYFGTSPRYGTRNISPEVDGQAWSLMTYTPAPGTSGFAGEKENQAQSFMQFDIAALQYMYGANFKTNATNSVYTWSATTGEMFINGVGQGAPTGNKILMTVWDGDGVDTYDLSNYAGGVSVDLRPGAFSTFDPAQLANHIARQGGVALAPGNVANALQYNGDARSLIENVVGGAGADSIIGNAANNVLQGGAGDDRLAGGAGSDTLEGGDGSDTASFADAAAGVTVVLNDNGTDVRVTVGADTDVLRSIENIVGSAGNDTLTGNSGANTLEGGSGGADTLNGGAGDDRLIGGGFTVTSTTTDRPDIVKPASTNNGSIATAVDTAGTYDLAARPDVANATTIPHTTINATAAGGSLEYYRVDVTAGSTLVFDIDTNSAQTTLDSWIELVDSAGTVLANNDTGASSDPGGTGNDDARLSYTFATAGTYYIRVGQWTTANPPTALPLTAGQTYSLHISNPSAQADGPVLSAVNTSAAVLNGGAGNDFLVGTLGNDMISGGADTDTVSYVNAFSTTATGVTVNLATTTAQNTGAAGTDTITGVENIIGSGYNDNLTGTAGANVVEGGAGADTMDGGAGTDTASYAGATAGVTVSLAAQGAAQNTGGAGSDTLTGFENLTGSSFNDSLSGDSAVNVLMGGAGDDLLNGNAAGATQAGLDTLDGGAGNDVASFAGYAGVVVAELNGASDVIATVDGVNQAVLRNIEGVAGGAGNDRLIGDARANVLRGAGGSDELSGGEGDDSLDGGAGDDLLLGGGGSDTAVFSGATAVTVDLRINGAQNTGQGLDTLIGIENLTGGTGADILIGDDGANVFTDTGGADTYSGNGGSDTLTYAFAGAGVVMNLALTTAQATGGGGSDTVSGIENVTGSAFGDTLAGTTDANTLIGLGGNDVLTGVQGNDLLFGGEGRDILYGDFNNSFSTGDGADVLEGGAGDDFLVGGQGADILRGGAGNDRLLGGLGTVATNFGSFTAFNNEGGDDTFDGGEGDDFAYIYVTDHTAGVSFNLANVPGDSIILTGGVQTGFFRSIERVIFGGGLGADVVTGTYDPDTLRGGAGDDVLNGFFGDDFIVGGLGNDILIGGDGLDTLSFADPITGVTTGATVDLRITTAQNTGAQGTDTISGFEFLRGSAYDDNFNGSDDFNFILDNLGGGDSFFGNGGNDELVIDRLGAFDAKSITLDGGAGDDLIFYNSCSVTGRANSGDGQSGTVDLGLSGTVITNLGATGTRYLDTVNVAGGDGSDRVVLTAVKTATVDLGSGADVVSVSLLGGAAESVHTLTLGAGADIIWVAGTGQTASTTERSNVVTDFQTGDAGDRFELSTFLNGTGTLVGYTPGSNPFQGSFLRLLQAGPDLLLQVDRDGAAGSAHSFVTLFTLRNVDGSTVTAFNMDGFSPVITATGTSAANTLTGGDRGDRLDGAGGDDILNGLGGNDVLIGGTGNDQLNGGAGQDTAVYASGIRAYSETVTGGNGGVSGGPDGNDTLNSVEVLRFLDGRVIMDAADETAQLNRLYVTVLGREVDYGGLQGFTAQLEGGASLASIAAALLGSPEFDGLDDSATNRQFVEGLYQRGLGRAGDAGGLDAYTAELDAGRLTKADVAVLFANSQEQMNRTQARTDAGFYVEDQTTSSIARLYYTAFDRAPDSGGLAGFRSAIDGGLTLQGVADAMASSQEFANIYGGTTNEQFVDRLYQVALGREADAAGRAAFIQALNDGASRASLLISFSQSQELRNLTASVIESGVVLFDQGPAAPVAGSEAAPDVDGPLAAGLDGDDAFGLSGVFDAGSDGFAASDAGGLWDAADAPVYGLDWSGFNLDAVNPDGWVH